jgi:serine/threonine protein kinase
MENSATGILTLSNTQAKELAGRLVTIGSETYYFKNYSADHPGQPPWRSGAEGKAYPLLGHDHTVAAYLKFFTRPTRKRLDRTSWLIGQQLHTWLPGLAAAPLVWADTRHAHRPATATLDFAGYLAQAVPGKTWLEWKHSISENAVSFSADLRWRCVRDLLLALAVLEQEGIVHGDLSPNNVVIDFAAGPDQPALYLIDFDAFVAPAAEGMERVTVAEGGTYGTEGYCPPDLLADAAEGHGDIAPRSDRYGRDMLLLELLIMDSGLPADDSPSGWNPEKLHRGYAAWQARALPDRGQSLAHIDLTTIFTLADHERPASSELAAAQGLSLPKAQGLRRLTRSRHSAPVVLGQPLPSAPRGHSLRQSALDRRQPIPATLNFIVPWRWSRPESDPAYRTFWQDVRVAAFFGAVLGLPVIIGLLAELLSALFGR